MKLLQINKLYPPHLGGIENVVRDIAASLASDHSWQSDVLVCQARGRRTEEKKDGVKIYRAASLGRLLSLPISWDFFRLFKKIVSDYDLLLIHHPFPLASLARLLFLDKKMPVAVWYHSDIIRQKFFSYLVYPFLYLDLKAATIIFVSSHRLAEQSQLLKKFIDKCRVIPFGVNVADYQANYELEVKDIKGKYSRFMLAVGRLVYYKGYLDLLAALETAPGKLLIIGRGPLEAKLREVIKKKNLADRVVIISNQPANLIPYYQACEFLIFPSNARTEAFGLVQLEAMACGKPVINTDLPTGVPEVSRDKESGLTVPVGDPHGLASAIASLWGNNDLLLRLGEQARQRVMRDFSQDKFKTDLKSALSKILF